MMNGTHTVKRDKDEIMKDVAWERMDWGFEEIESDTPAHSASEYTEQYRLQPSRGRRLVLVNRKHIPDVICRPIWAALLPEEARNRRSKSCNLFIKWWMERSNRQRR